MAGSDVTAEGRTGVSATWRDAPTAAKALIIGTFVHRLGAFVQVFLVLYLTQRGFSTGQAGLALGLFGAGSVLGVLIGGGLSDRLGPRRTIIGAMLLTALLLPSVLYLSSYPALVTVLVLIGAVSQAYRPASTSMLSQLIPEQRHVMAFAMVRLAINLGTSIGPLLGAALVAVSYDLLFWGEGLTTLVFAGIAALALPRAAATNAPSETAGSGPTGGGGSYLAVLADRRYLLFLFGIFATTMIYIQYVAALPLAVHADGLRTVVYGALVALNGLIVITCELLVATRVQHWPARVAAATGVLLTAIGLTLYGLPWPLAGFLLGTLIWSFGETIGYPTLFFAYPAKAGPVHLRGRYLGASNSVYGLGTALGPVAGIAVWNAVGDRIWLCCGVLGLIAAAATWLGVASKPPAVCPPSPVAEPSVTR